MGWIAAGGLALGLGSSVFKGVTGANQKAQASQINPNDPGYQINQQIIDNAKTLSDKYNNYVMPGYSVAKNDLDNSLATAMSSAREGATSSGDLLDAASKFNFNQNKALNNLNVTGAQMKESLLPQVLQANAAAGNEAVLNNKFDNDRYDQQVKAKAALNQAGNTNLFGAIDGIASAGGAFLSYQGGHEKTGAKRDKAIDGNSIPPSLFDTYNKWLKNSSAGGSSITYQ